VTGRLKSINNYEIVVPRRVDERGLPFPVHQYYTRHGRYKRDSLSSSSSSWSSLPSLPVFTFDGDDDGETFYELSAFGRQMILRLGPATGSEFIGRGVVVQHMADNETWLGAPLNYSDHCFRRGSIDGDRTSKVVLSTCDSLVSL